MLTGLRLSNIGLIDSLELRFQDGFTVLTGETGAGKSIFFDAIDALLGGFHGLAGFRLPRTGCDSAVIEATFSLNPLVESWLNEQSFDLEGSDVFLSREWRKKDEGFTSRYRINGLCVNRQQILAIRPLLVDLTLQGQTIDFFKIGYARSMLDRIGGNSLHRIILDVKESWNTWHKNFTLLQQTKLEIQDSELTYKQDQEIFNELFLADLKDPSEFDRLQKEEDKLANSVRLKDGIIQVVALLENGDVSFPSVLDQIANCVSHLNSISNFDAALEEQNNKLLALQADISEMAYYLHGYLDSLDSNSSRLDELQERIALIKRLERKHGLGLKQLIVLQNTLDKKLNRDHGSRSLTSLEEGESKSRKIFISACDRLSKARQQIANVFEKQMTNYLISLGLEHVRFKIEIQSSEPDQYGADFIGFMFSANPGEPLRPLNEVASGGELSRILLALKTILAKVDHSSSLFFDEIDSGVSGRTSSSIANLLKKVSSDRQVFCITHQPLIAAAAHHHFRVSKLSKNDLTYSKIELLSDIQDRQNELAELAGGDFEEAGIYAASLLEQQVA